MKVRALDENGYPIDHSAVRFRKVMSVPSIPKPGESIDLETTSGRILKATVVRADWSDDRSLFVVACQHAQRSISADEYASLVNDPHWLLTPLI